MTLEEWEQENIAVLTSKEMGLWLGRRDSRLLKQIKSEINRKANSGQWSEAVIYGLQKAIGIIDNHIIEGLDTE